MSRLVIGVLGLQGAVTEHINQVETSGCNGVIVKKPEQLKEIDGLILPGGESTTMRKLIERYGFFEPLKQFSKQRKPLFGTCAGMVLVAKELSASSEAHLQLMDVRVKRNAFGRQKESFEAVLPIKGLDLPFSAVFIRAPYIEKAAQHVEIISTYENHIVAAKQDHILVTAFHPELTNDTRMIEIFIDMVKKSKNTVAL
ncbi:pyridoxal 5'-phosphate synthase glutaminase subunit PdxT [Ornithinibacillus sp. BX22]|uniref:Pyridoxal 5'-phosphate synthase subunit PdxT n=2 Tax=Ornithinibacillus TaxID=484508 RepID=A0A923RGV5_9BACI|nr:MULTISPECIES: pyridoxal 5'-phosphate synthase glutaminase subunit PdxT [Ornithinibacillus]MBC5636201.1 pyridoxal 5'-phosphate synthase glutaminase subunit PdxT [Ornithinibacillus hominis]MBS3681041.1 pyridoxal 5'-phosphate synthase glutaminase subunit PdxT [Ornithinibacillus massiliensis]